MRHALLVCAAVLCFSLTACAAEPVNWAAAGQGGTVTGPQNSSQSQSRPPVANDERFDGYAWAYLTTPLVVQFAAPQTIDTLEVYLYHEDSQWYRFYAEVTGDGTTWTRVAEKTEGKPTGWQTLRFAPVECRQVRLTFTDTSVEARSYHVVEVAAYRLDDPKGVSPLRQRHLQQIELRHRTNAQILLDCIGPNASMPDEQRKLVLAAPAGQRLTTDTDGDGDPDICDFVDTDPRHTVRPMLVRIIDDDDDMEASGLGDEDADCYVADWRGDGSVDRVVDYWDYDRDGDADRMDIYYAAGGWHGPNVEVVVIRDIGDDNRMWWTKNYEYSQYTCQWNSDFNGDEIFCMFEYDGSAAQFVPFLEEPFTHHDLDGDGVSEMTMQFMGRGLDIRTLRFSFDADNDTDAAQNRRDYDFSFNCIGLARVPDEKSIFETLRNGETTGRYLDWPCARDVAETGGWQSCRLCWDEIDNNVNPADKIEKYQERWEGVGGYPMNEGNKRWETDKDYSGKMHLYYWEGDRRLHLYGAEAGFINVDYDHDTKTDAKITYQDRDGDGFFDHWSWDGDADGKPEYTAARTGDCYRFASLQDYAPFVDNYRRLVQAAIDADEALITTLRAKLGDTARSPSSDWWGVGRLQAFYAAEKLGRSAEARRYYLDLTRQELFMLAADRYADTAWWAGFLSAYEAGDYAAAAAVAQPAQ